MVVGGLPNQFGLPDGSAIDGDFIGTRIQQALNIGHLSHPASYGQRNEDFAGYGFDDGQDEITLVAGGGDIQKGEFIGTLLVVATSDFDRVSRVGKADKIDTLHDPTGRDVQAGDDAAAEIAAGVGSGVAHDSVSSSASCWAAAKSSVPS